MCPMSVGAPEVGGAEGASVDGEEVGLPGSRRLGLVVGTPLRIVAGAIVWVLRVVPCVGETAMDGEL